MEYADPTGARLSRPRRFGWVLLGVWTTVVAASLIWNLAQQRRETLTLAYTTALTLYEKDLIYRRWAADHGGVYVPVTAATPPSPYLSHLPERDLQTPSGRRLTLINPAYMTRQVYELAQESRQPQGHLHSLKPLRPENIPDSWETAALKAFEQGQTEVRGIEKPDGNEVFRLMRPFITEKSCLGCHAGQGYRLGDIRGGISLAVPMASLRQAQDSMQVALVGGHGLLWLLGALGIMVAVRNLEKAHRRIITLANTDSLTCRPLSGKKTWPPGLAGRNSSSCCRVLLYAVRVQNLPFPFLKWSRCRPPPGTRRIRDNRWVPGRICPPWCRPREPSVDQGADLTLDRLVALVERGQGQAR
jgi:hypothetical protein